MGTDTPADRGASKPPRATLDRQPASAGSQDSERLSATRQSIVEAAHVLVRRYGPRKITVEDVARAARVSRPTVYAHFGDKQGLLTAVFLWNGHLVREELEVRLQKANTFADKIVEAADYGVSAESPLWLRSTEPESLALTLTTWSATWLERAGQFWLPYVQEGQEGGEIRRELDAAETAHWVARSLYALAIMTPAVPTKVQLDEIRHQARVFIAGGLAYSDRT